MSEVFNPGEPLDIIKLNDMYSRLTKTEGTLIGIQDSSKEATNFKITTGALSQTLTPTTKDQVVTINYGTTYRSIPSIIVTPYGIADNVTGKLFYSVGGTYSTTGANIHYWTDDKTWLGGTIGFFWVAIGLPQV
jgi:hypothetical protein